MSAVFFLVDFLLFYVNLYAIGINNNCNPYAMKFPYFQLIRTVVFLFAGVHFGQ